MNPRQRNFILKGGALPRGRADVVGPLGLEKKR